jgi:DNA-binding transcriptional ArsR family regulator
MAANETRRNGDGEDSDRALLKALTHRLRLELLRLILDRQVLSPSEAALIKELPLSNVSYHFRVLAAAGAVELRKTEPVRGSIQHFYGPAEKVKADWVIDLLPLSEDP